MTKELTPEVRKKFNLEVLKDNALYICRALDGDEWPIGAARYFSSLPPYTNNDLRRALERIYSYEDKEPSSE